MSTYTLRAVTRDADGGITDIADSWPLNSASVSEAKIEVDGQDWGKGSDDANAFEIVDESGATVSWRPLRSGDDLADWT
jgi:hypothetical protein